MKILYVYYAIASFGGIERVFVDKMNCLAKMGYDVYLLTANQGDHPIPFRLNENVHVEDMNILTHKQYQYQGLHRYWKHFQLNRLLYRRLREKIQLITPDIIISPINGYISELVNLKSGLPIIAESHAGFDDFMNDLNISWRHRIDLMYKIKKLQKVDVIVALTENDARKWKKQYNNVRVIPNVVHLNESGIISKCDTKRVIFVGRNCKQKAIPDLLKVWQIVHTKYPDWQLDMYVALEIKDLVEEVKVLNANINVYPPVSDIMERFIQSSILVLTSLYESFSLVTVEAMSCGLPVVTYESDGPCSIITDGQDGFVVKDRNTQNFVNRICQLIEDKNLRQRIGRKAFISSQRFTEDKVMPMWIELFNNFKKEL